MKSNRLLYFNLSSFVQNVKKREIFNRIIDILRKESLKILQQLLLT